MSEYMDKSTRRTLIIAEAGVNHNGKLEWAYKLIEAAAEAGADYVKFQTFQASKLVSKTASMADYQVKNTGHETSQLEMLKKLQLSREDHVLLIEHCRKFGIKFLSTAFDDESLELLYTLGIDLFKIPSGEITNKPFLKRIASFRKPVIVSTGMSDKQEIQDALNVLVENGVPLGSITVMHCNTEYPTPFEDVHLLAMHDIQETFHVQIGYSDHTLGIEVPIAAVALGAICIEKHFTLDRTMDGPDHKASLEPLELKAMVKGIRNIEQAIGVKNKQISNSELKNKVIARKSIHLAMDLSKGSEIKNSDLIMKRPGDGISPMRIDEVVGKKLRRDLCEDTKLSWEDLE
jgi:N-acetylneuraminate synthase